MYPFKKPRVFIVTLVVCQLAGILGTLFTTPGVKNWYPTLVKPTFTPPNWIFGPVWTLLFTLMACSFYLVYTAKKNPYKKQALTFFATQLFLNFFWNVLFFGMQNPLVAAFEIVLLLGFIILTTYYSLRVRLVAAVLLVPYILWVSFATMLNISIVLLN